MTTELNNYSIFATSNKHQQSAFMDEQQLFTAQELLKLGFRKQKDGGYYYYIRDFNSDVLNGEAMQTNDMMNGVNNPLFHVELTKAVPKVRLTRAEIIMFNEVHPKNEQTKIHFTKS